MRGSPRGARKALDRLGAQGKAESTTVASGDPGRKKTGIRCCGACQLAFVAVVVVAERGWLRWRSTREAVAAVMRGGMTAMALG